MNPIRPLLSLIALLLASASVMAAPPSLEECYDLARDNYPLIKRYGLLDRTVEIELSDINRSWLPTLTLSAQSTIQNPVANLPESLTSIMAQMGRDVKGLSPWQSRVGLDLSQPIWDGGISQTRREITRSRLQLEQQSLDVELYTLRQTIENLYFAILLTDEQIEQSQATRAMLEANLRTLRARLANGTAMQADVDMVEARILTLDQSIATARAATGSYRAALEIYIGRVVGSDPLPMPSDQIPQSLNPDSRPEMQLLDSRKNLILTQDRLTRRQLRPTIGLFAQTFYGYPGYDNFKSMLDRKWTFNAMAGIRINWRINAFFDLKNRHAQTRNSLADIDIDRDTFVFNNRIAATRQNEIIAGIRNVMESDAQIIALLSSVRRAAEAQLTDGVSDTTQLISKITDENIAILNAKYHRIQYLREICTLRYILNQ